MKRFVAAVGFVCLMIAGAFGQESQLITPGKRIAAVGWTNPQYLDDGIAWTTTNQGALKATHAAPEGLVVYDLGSAYTLTRAELDEDNAGGYQCSQWRLQYSADNNAWFDAFPNTATPIAGWNAVDFTDVNARYVRFVCSYTGTVEVGELHCFGIPTGSQAPTIPSNQPADQTVNAGQPASFSVTASGTAPLTYAWKKVHGTTTSDVGTNSNSYQISATTSADNGDHYYVIVTNSAGSATSRSALLTVNVPGTPPSIPADQPADQSVNVGQPATFSVTASGTLPLTYAWKKIHGTTTTDVGTNSNSYQIPATTSADNLDKYYVIVSNSAGNKTSREALLTVITPTACDLSCNSDDMIWNHRAILVGPNCKTPGDPGLTLGGWFYNLRGDADADGNIEMTDMAPGSATVTNASGTTTINGGAVAAKSVNAENITTTGSLNAVDATLTGALNAGSATVSGYLSASGASIDQIYVPGAVTAGSVRVNGDLLGGGTATLANVNVTSSLNAGSAGITGNLNAGSAEIAGNLNAGYTTVSNITVSGPEITTYMSPDGFTSSNFGGATSIRGNVIETHSINGIQLSQYGFNVGRTRINPEDIRTTQVYTATLKITQSPWSDFVFAKEYNLMPLDKIEKFIKQYGHLPDMPSEAEVKKDGVDVGEVQAKLLQKVEELTLHAIALEKKVNALAEENNSLKTRISHLKAK